MFGSLAVNPYLNQQMQQFQQQKAAQAAQQAQAPQSANGSWQPGAPNAAQGEFYLPGYATRDQQYQNYAGHLWGQGQGYQQANQALINMLQGQANGTGPSLAQMQYRQASDNAMKQQQAFAASAAPQNQAMAARLASQNMGNIGQGMASGLAQAGLQERMAAAGQLGQQINAGNAQNNAALAQMLGLAQQNAAQQGDMQKAWEQNDTNRYQIRASQPSDWQQFAGIASPILGAVGGGMFNGLFGGGGDMASGPGGSAFGNMATQAAGYRPSPQWSLTSGAPGSIPNTATGNYNYFGD